MTAIDDAALMALLPTLGTTSKVTVDRRSREVRIQTDVAIAAGWPA
jgi:hypothetical protein